MNALKKIVLLAAGAGICALALELGHAAVHDDSEDAPRLIKVSACVCLLKAI